MVPCRICLEDLKRPVALPCGHIFCNDCIVQTARAVKPHNHLQPCPICRSIYNIAPINLNVVPANLRIFVTPSIRRVYLEPPLSPQEENTTTDVNEQTVGSSSPVAMTSSESELSCLRVENQALRNSCAMWRKRAEMHGAANLSLLKFARVIRDQASALAREREQLKKRCHSLKRKIEDDEMEKYSEVATVESFLRSTSEPQDFSSPDPCSLLFAPPFRCSPTRGTSEQRLTTEATASSPKEPPPGDSDINRPRKRSKTDDSPFGPASAKRATQTFVSENLAHGQGGPGQTTVHREPLTP